MVLLSTHNICFGLEIRKLNFRYPLLTKVLGKYISIQCHTFISCTPDQDFHCIYPCEIILSHIPIPAHGKIKKEQPHVRHMSIRDVIIVLKWHHLVASQRIQDFLEAFFMFFQYKMRYLVVSQKKSPLFVWGWDRKICFSWSPFGINRQASWCQSVILGTDFSILLSWRILMSSPYYKMNLDITWSCCGSHFFTMA